MTMPFATSLVCSSFILLTACSSNNTHSQEQQSSSKQTQTANQPIAIQQSFKTQQIANFDEPWALAQLPDGRLLVTERQGVLKIFDPTSKQMLQVSGVPKVRYGGQGGLGDVICILNLAKITGFI